jgi:hypothetical protein
MKISAIFFTAVFAGRNPMNHLDSVMGFAGEMIKNFKSDHAELNTKRLPQYEKTIVRLTTKWNS